MKRPALLFAGAPLAVLAALTLMTRCVAADEPARPWYEAIAVHGLVESSWAFNFNHPDAGLNGLRVFDFEDRTLQIDQVELAVQRAADATSRAGFRFDLVAGSAVPKIEAASGLFRDPDTGEAGDFDLQQGFVTWLAPVGAGLKLDAGKFVTHLGYELIDGYDGFNDNVSRSILFGYAVPFTHTGLRASYPLNPQWSAMVCLVNGWDNARDNNDALTAGAQLGWTPRSDLVVYLNVITGREGSSDETGRRGVVDVVATWKASPAVTLGFNGDFGHEADALGANKAEWSGLAGYLRWQACPRMSLTARAETFDDGDGVRTGTAQTVRELTLTPDFQLADGLRFRADLRHDWSDEAVFDKKGDAVKTQTTLTGQLVVTF